jgi:uncharacterized DUF497 family protein
MMRIIVLQLYIQKSYNWCRKVGGCVEFEGFEWNAGNMAKCQKHGLSLADIESVFSGPVLILNDAANSEAESRFRAIGVTERGRRAFIVFTWRGKRLRPLSARYMHRKEITRYEKDNPDIQKR